MSLLLRWEEAIFYYVDEIGGEAYKSTVGYNSIIIHITSSSTSVFLSRHGGSEKTPHGMASEMFHYNMFPRGFIGVRREIGQASAFRRPSLSPFAAQP